MPKIESTPPRVLHAEVLLPAEDINRCVAFFVDQLGFRVLGIFPADAPRTGILEGYGLRLRLQVGAQTPPGQLRLECESLPAGEEQLVAPNGTRISLIAADAELKLPSLIPEFVLTRAAGGVWGEGRAGMRYRDLIPSRLGGRFIASHIQIQAGGPVPDYVHYHRVRFQMIFCLRGWVRVVYEDQGESFVLEAGDCVLQPPQIRHRVLEASPGLEVVELGCPALHETLGDSGLTLPTAQLCPERLFGGQRFLRHVASRSTWSPASHPGFEERDFGMQAATAGLAGARVLRPLADSSSAQGAEPGAYCHAAELSFCFVIRGELALARPGMEPLMLSAGDSCVVPAGMPHRLSSSNAACRWLGVSLPGKLALEPAAE